MTIHEGRLVAPKAKIGIVVARFNELVTERLLEGAVSALVRHGGSQDQIEVVRVPGAFEIPLAAQKLAQTGRFGAVLCLGSVIRGATSHYEYVCGPTASGIMNAGMQTGLPIIFGVLTTDTLDQAFERAGSKAGNKGAEAMVTALEMIDLLGQIEA